MTQLDFVECKASFLADDTGRVTGKAWDFTSPDRVGDVIEPAAFAGAVGKSLPMLFAHDQAQAVGVWDQIAVEQDGLSVSGKLLVDDVSRAKEVRALLQAKAVTGLSVGFMTKKAAPRKGGGRTISDLDLVEVSLVSVPAHDRARISNVKDMSMTANAALNTENTETPAAPAAAAPAVDTKALDAIQKRLDAIEAKGNRLAADNDNGDDDTKLDTKAISEWAKSGRLNDMDVKTLVVGTPSAGGYTVTDDFRAEIIKQITELNPIRQLASVTSTGTNKVLWPVLASDAEGSWVSEVASRTTDEPTFSQVAIDIFEHGLIVPISRQLLEDSVVDMAGLLAERIAVGFAKAESTAFLTGSGTGEPSGILDALANIAGENDSADILDDIIDAFYALPSQYAARGSWLMNRPTIAAIRKAADLSDNRNGIWSDSLAVGTPARLLGAPVYEAPGLDTHGATASGAAGASVIFGDISSAFRIVDRVGLDILRDDFTGAANGIVRFHARKRVGSAVVQPEALVAIKTA
ncbi:MAG: phage major capsid protein [Aquamicrobium sp.]|uniref:phage major capsid protein n=1 Tax=Aquamicrobium sp. TaxID=1872579 RepID=UPI00349ECDBE|nr:phage major capsid protein [Aquamicrobium sp.]MCO5158962.1 phage major capsid protein [Aquamicrobium sp.]